MQEINISITKKRYSEKMVFLGKYILFEDISYPFCEAKGFGRFNKYYLNVFRSVHKSVISEYYKSARMQYLKEGFEPYRIKCDFDIFSYKSILSVVIKTSIFEGGSYEKCNISCANWDITKDKLVEFEQLFPKNAKQIAIDNIKNQAYYNKKTAKNTYYSDYAQSIEKYFNMNNFYINSSNAVFIYPACTIAPCSEGTVFFEVPVNSLL